MKNIFYIGQGFDIHRLQEGLPLIIGGVNISSDYGLVGHSDADVLIHALIDALLGASRMGDIGQYFPDTDINYKGINSRFMLKDIFKKISDANFIISNIDATIHAENPKMSPYIKDMISNISDDLNLEKKLINIKSKTNEGMGYIGRREGIAASVVLLLVSTK